MSKEKKELTFETAIKELEEILERLENEDTPLDQMVLLYEQANKLAEIYRNKLESANQKISKLVKGEDGKYLEE